ncbi:MAG: hypothetical protein ABH812_03855 [bacterium]
MPAEFQPLSKSDINRAQEAQRVFPSRLKQLRKINKKLKLAMLLNETFPGLIQTKAFTQIPYILQTTHYSDFLLTAVDVNPIKYRVTVTINESVFNETSQEVGGIERTQGVELAFLNPLHNDINLAIGYLDIPGCFVTSVHQPNEFLQQNDIEVLQKRIKSILQGKYPSVS